MTLKSEEHERHYSKFQQICVEVKDIWNSIKVVNDYTQRNNYQLFLK